MNIRIYRYEYDTNEYLYRKIFDYIRKSEYLSHPVWQPSVQGDVYETFKAESEKKHPVCLCS